MHPATLANFVSTQIRPKGVRTGGSRERPTAMHSRVAFCIFFRLLNLVAVSWVTVLFVNLRLGRFLLGGYR